MLSALEKHGMSVYVATCNPKQADHDRHTKGKSLRAWGNAAGGAARAGLAQTDYSTRVFPLAVRAFFYTHFRCWHDLIRTH